LVSLLAPQGFDLDVDDFSGATPAVTKIDPSAANNPAVWSSDGTSLAYWSLDNRTLNVYGSSGTITIALPASLWNGSFLYGPNPWLPDGSGLVFWGQANPQDYGQIFYIDAVSGAVPLALTDAGMSVPNGAVNASPDGGGLAFIGATASDGTMDVWYLDLRSRQRSLPTKANGTVKRAFNPVLWSPVRACCSWPRPSRR
jgi:Tol biopolymer transport system component